MNQIINRPFIWHTRVVAHYKERLQQQTEKLQHLLFGTYYTFPNITLEMICAITQNTCATFLTCLTYILREAIAYDKKSPIS